MPTTTSSRDNWGRLVEAVLKREQIRQLCHQDSITTVDSDFSELNISPRSVYSSPSPQLPLTIDLVVEEDHFGVERFSLCELRVATHNFSNKKILGKCIYGRVYKGRLADGSIVAVKRLTAEESDELEISSIVAHRNVIGLRGFCITKRKRLLVYPYMANRSVSQCLRERYKSQPPLDRAIRQRIALGVARGLAYLHHECLGGIIHGDIKAENILLDEEFEAVLAGFSLAKFMDCNGIKGSTGFGEGKCSLKSDVYGYGVFLLELITAQQSCGLAWLEYDDDDMKDIDHVIYWVMKLCKDKDFAVMVDRDLEGNFIEEEVEKLLRIALICRQTDPEGRPTMPEVTSWMLEDGEGLTKMWEEFSRNVYKTRRTKQTVWTKMIGANT